MCKKGVENVNTYIHYIETCQGVELFMVVDCITIVA